MTREEVIDYLYEFDCHAAITIESMAEDLAASATPQWVPCNERLPEEDVDVLVTNSAGGMINIEVDACGAYEETGERFWYTAQNPIAWMPLPEAYDEENINE